MLGTLPQALQKFFGFVGASLTGITALFTALGFLAERARLTMLGLPGTAFDLQQYVETGARLFAFLPLYLGTALLLTVADLVGLGASEALVATPADPPPAAAAPFPSASAAAETLRVVPARDTGGTGLWLLLLALVFATGLLVYYRLHRSALAEQMPVRRATVFATAGTLARRHGKLLLLLFLLLQFAGACQQTRTIRVHDLLFRPPPVAVEAGRFVPFASPETLERWVRYGPQAHAVQYIGWLFLLTLLSAWGLYAVLKRFDRSTAGVRGRTWVVASLLLLVSQVTLLPINYGILLSSTRFPSVCVTPAAEAGSALQLASPVNLLHETDHGYYFYAHRERHMWFVPRAHVDRVRYEGTTDVLATPVSPIPCS